MLASVVALAGCSSSAIKPENTVSGPSGSAQGQWRGQALVRNLQNNKSGTISLDIVAHEPSQMRMEVTGMMGIYLASFAMQGNQVQYILTQQKKFVSAPADANALRDLVPIRITPHELLQILFDRPLSKKDWICSNSSAKAIVGGIVEENALKNCLHVEDSIRITWLEQKAGHRKLKIESPNAEATLVLDESRSKVELKESTFTLSAPLGYRQEIRPSK